MFIVLEQRMTVRLYLRVSTRNQSESGFSLAAQRAKGEAWAAYQEYTDVRTYEDAGISGTRDDRPGLTALLLDLQAGDIVVAYALSRLARGGAVQLLGIVRDIRARGARVVFLQENIDTDTSTGRLMLTILAALAELELEQTRERTDMGRTQAALEGIYPHSSDSLPMGWTTDERGRIVEDTTKAETVRLIFQQGTASYLSTARLLTSLGLAAERGGEWQVQQVRRIVRFDGYYTGQLNYRAATRPNEPGEHIIIAAPALIDRATWEAAQRDARTNNAHRRPDLFPLSGHLRCACGARLGGRQRKPIPGKEHWTTHDQYVCFDHMRKTPTCPTNNRRTRTYRSERLHAAARVLVADLLSSPSDPVGLGRAYGGEVRPDVNAVERAELERKQLALLDLFLEKVIDRATYDLRRSTLAARLAALVPPIPHAPVTMPARPDLAAGVLTCSNLEFSELLDTLGIEMVVTGLDVLEISKYSPVLG